VGGTVTAVAPPAGDRLSRRGDAPGAAATDARGVRETTARHVATTPDPGVVRSSPCA